MSAKNQIMLFILLAFLVPPVGWVLVCWYATLWSLQEMLTIVVFEPYILIYIVPFVTAVVWFSQRKLNFLEANQDATDRDTISKAQSDIASLPRMIMLFMVVYCFLGPMVSMMSKDFIGRVEWIICEMLGVPFILLFSMPFIILIMYRLEAWMGKIPLAESRKVISFKARMYISGVMNICGLLMSVILVMVAVAYKHESSGNLFSLMLTKSIPLALFGILVGVFNIALVTGIMTKGILDAVALAEAISRGNLCQSLELRSKDEMGRLGVALNNMVESLRQQARQTLDGVSFLASSAEQISTTVAELMANTSRISTAVAETSSTVEEVKQVAQMAAEKCKGVAATAQQAVHVSETGRKATTETCERMNHIKEQMESIGETVVKLSDHSRSIGNIIDTVQDLADQSNLLAVNASIEAARAGEQGKGFAVVAHEIKTLAEQSREATQRVRAILEDTRSWVSAVVMATEQGRKAVVMGLEQSLTAGQSIDRLYDSVKTSHEVTTIIESSSAQQAIGVEQVAQAMSIIVESMQQNLTGTTQLASAASKIAELGSTLRDLVARYKM